MIPPDDDKHPKLQAPGAGLPRVELFMARILVGMKLRKNTPRKSLETFVRERHEILSLVSSVEPELAARQVLINRLRGLEDSSRYWSIYMTLEHLSLVNRSAIEIIKMLVEGGRPSFVASTANVKPKAGIDARAMTNFAAVCDEFEASFPLGVDLRTETTFKHPWFGELNAEKWHFFAGFHMQLHRVQVERIIGQLSRGHPDGAHSSRT